MPGTDLGTGFGEQVTTTVDHTSSSPYDCLSWAAIIFSTTVQDADEDGLLDKLELSTAVLKEPNGEAPAQYPRHGSGRPVGGPSASIKDLFVEVGFMTTDAYNIAGGQGPVAAHSHRPTPAALKMIGDALWCAGVVPCDASVLNPSNRVRVHFDVGSAYPSL